MTTIDAASFGLAPLLATTALPTAATQEIGTATAPAPASYQALIEAAQRQDIAEVRRLLDQGADIETRSRYGASALSFAVDQGNRDLVALLLARGADVSVKDRFYNFTPAALAMMKASSSPAHREVLVMLIQKGVDDIDSALLFGVQIGDFEVINAAITSGKASPRDFVPDLATGALRWTLAPNSEVTVATPVVADGLVYVTANYPPVRPIYAIKPGGRGDISPTGGETRGEWVAWSIQPGGVYIPTPIVYQGVLYALQMNGRLTAYDAKTGEVLYRQRVGHADSFSGSAAAADGRLYFTTEEGTTYVVQAGREYALLGTNEVDEVVVTTPAIADGLFLVRGLHHLYAFAEPEPGKD